MLRLCEITPQLSLVVRQWVLLILVYIGVADAICQLRWQPSLQLKKRQLAWPIYGANYRYFLIFTGRF
jgi:hypothetical protein